MALQLQSSGESISFGQIIAEFGGAPATNESGYSLGNYRVSETYGELKDIPLDTGIPQPTQQNPSPPIAFSDFYGKRLNMVVNFYDNLNSGGASIVAKQNMKSKFEEPNKVKVVGGFLPPDTGTSTGKRVIINVSKIIAPRLSSSYKPSKGTWSGYNPDPPNNKNEVSMITGDWDADTKLDLWVGGSGFIVGAGGAGGKNGRSGGGRNGPGDRGTSALGVTYPLNIYNYGYIAGGGGGGGGSPYYQSERSRGGRRRRTEWIFWRSRGRSRQVRSADGSPGGGGAGYSGLAPGGTNDQYGGPGGANRGNGRAAGAGTLTLGGDGGASNGRGSVAGGAGGALGFPGTSIDTNGAGGDAGHAIIISGSGTATVMVGNNNVVGGTHNGQIDF